MFNKKSVVNKVADAFKRPATLTKEQNEILDTVNFPHEIKGGFVLQRRVKKVKMSGVFVEKQSIDITDLAYTVVNRPVAIREDLELFKPKNVQEEKLIEQRIQGQSKSQSFKINYFSADVAGFEMQWILSRFGAPTATESMKVEEKAEVVEELTDEQKEVIEAKLQENLSAKEIAKELGVKQPLVTKYIKSLKDGKE